MRFFPYSAAIEMLLHFHWFVRISKCNVVSAGASISSENLSRYLIFMVVRPIFGLVL